MSFRHEESLSCSHCRQALGQRSSRPGPLPPHSLPWATPQFRKDRPVLPTHQILDLNLDVSGKTISGYCDIDIVTTHASVESFFLEAVDLKIAAVTVDGASAKFRHEEETLTILPAKKLSRGDKARVRISYAVTEPRAGIYFVAPDEAYKKKPLQVFTQGQDDDSRYWFPCFDEPGIKFTSEMKVRAPHGFICTSNGKLVSEKRGSDAWEFHWKMDQPVPAYLITLTAGEFAEIKTEWKGKPVHYLAEKGREDELKRSCDKTPDMMDHFSQLLGVDYPYDKYHQIVVSEFTFGGMENTSATTLTDLTLHPREVDENYSSVDLVAHELAHQWFGDWVTCKTWSHGWLNESWATFMEYVYKLRNMGPEETQYYCYEDLKTYLSEDSHSYRRPIVTNVYSDPAEIWDRHLYQKGGLVLNMLRAEIGEDAFWKGTQIYLKRHAGGVVETIDFQRALEEAVQRPLDWFFDQWVYKGGHPELKVSFEWNEKEKLGQLQIEQTQKADFLTPIHTLNSSFEIHYELGRIETLPVHMKSSSQTFVFKAESKPKAIRFDTGNTLLKTLDWSLPEEMVLEQLRLPGDVVGKIWALKTLAKKPTRKSEEALIERLKQDPFWGVRGEAAELLATIKSDRAMKALCEALRADKDGRSRVMIVSALGNFKSSIAFESLKMAAESEKNPFAQAHAISAMGKTKAKGAFEEILKYKERDSWNELIRKHVFFGLKNLEDERGLPVVKAGTEYGQPYWSRPVAIQCLGDMAIEKTDIDHLLVDLLRDKQFHVPRAAIGAIEKRGKPEFAYELDSLGFATVDGHLKFGAHSAAQRLRDGSRKKDSVTALKDDLEKMLDENKKLRERVEILEQKMEIK